MATLQHHFTSFVSSVRDLFGDNDDESPPVFRFCDIILNGEMKVCEKILGRYD